MSALPLLFKTDKKGEIRYWECMVEGDTYYTRAGVWKNRDTHTWKPHTRRSRQEIGHGAYRTASEVALEHAWSDWDTKKRNDNMVESIEEVLDPSRLKYQIPLSPALAMKYKELLERHNNPRSKFHFDQAISYFVEPKYDG